MNREDLLVIIPAFNEEDDIVAVADEVGGLGYSLVVVNDASTDSTLSRLRDNHIPAIDLPVHLGLSAAIQTGMRYALARGFSAAIQIDGDGQHDPRYIEPMLAALSEGKCDMVIGSRYMTRRESLPRALGNALISGAIFIKTARRLRDCTSGMRLYSLGLMRRFAADDRLRPEPDTLCLLIKQGLDIRECPVTMRKRRSGASYLGGLSAARYMLRMALSILLIQPFRGR